MEFLDPLQPALVLAPMEGVTDAPMRQFLSRTGYYDYCVSEFIRVSANPLLSKTFYKYVPELKSLGLTSSQIPVQVQLLGGNPERMAESAKNAIQAGARAIDLNFGCPAPTVNRHDGGATLLKYPDRIEAIIRAVREAVPEKFPVSAKMRLGFDDPKAIYENAKRAEKAGATWITIHGRTKTQGYTPPAYWKPIGEVKKMLSIPVIANGEIWTIEDFKRCRDETGCNHFMIGRGALALPNLGAEIRKELGLPIIPVAKPLYPPFELSGKTWAKFFKEYAEAQNSEKKIKQWARYVKSKQAITWWDAIKILGSVKEILNHLEQLQEAPSSASTKEVHQSRTES